MKRLFNIPAYFSSCFSLWQKVYHSHASIVLKKIIDSSRSNQWCVLHRGL